MMTRCPNCSTAFIVSPAQIKVRAGTVRCGECAVVFNALDTLMEVASGKAADSHANSETSSEMLHARADVRDEMSDTSAQRDATSDIAAETDAILDEILGHHEDEAVSAVSADDTGHGGDVSTDAEPYVIDESGDAYAPHLAPHSAPSSAQPSSQQMLTDYLGSPRRAKRTATAATSRRWPWLLGSTIAGLALLLQAIYYYRIDLSVLRPELKPVLQAACRPFGCEVPRPSQIDTLSIDTSDLRPDPQQPGRLTLTATLRSKAPFAQEWPLLELTLTDVGDRKLVVKQFAASDYLAGDNDMKRLLASGFPANDEIAVTLPLDIGNLPAAGYRLYIFYP